MKYFQIRAITVVDRIHDIDGVMNLTYNFEQQCQLTWGNEYSSCEGKNFENFLNCESN